jgi:hypothetical protein
MSLINLLYISFYNNFINYNNEDNNEDDDKNGNKDNDFPLINKLLAFSSKGILIVY